jgi:hypothetical protein
MSFLFRSSGGWWHVLFIRGSALPSVGPFLHFEEHCTGERNDSSNKSGAFRQATPEQNWAREKTSIQAKTRQTEHARTRAVQMSLGQDCPRQCISNYLWSGVVPSQHSQNLKQTLQTAGNPPVGVGCDGKELRRDACVLVGRNLNSYQLNSYQSARQTRVFRVFCLASILPKARM